MPQSWMDNSAHLMLTMIRLMLLKYVELIHELHLSLVGFHVCSEDVQNHQSLLKDSACYAEMFTCLTMKCYKLQSRFYLNRSTDHFPFSSVLELAIGPLLYFQLRLTLQQIDLSNLSRAWTCNWPSLHCFDLARTCNKAFFQIQIALEPPVSQLVQCKSCLNLQ